jgi:hypothetical protein
MIIPRFEAEGLFEVAFSTTVLSHVEGFVGGSSSVTGSINTTIVVGPARIRVSTEIDTAGYHDACRRHENEVNEKLAEVRSIRLSESSR